MSDITLPDAAIDIIAGRCGADLLSQNLYAAYWLHGRDNLASLMCFQSAHQELASVADAMGYTIARKVAPASVEDAA